MHQSEGTNAVMKKPQVPSATASATSTRTRAAGSKAGVRLKGKAAAPPTRKLKAATPVKPATKPPVKPAIRGNAKPQPAPDLYSSIHALLHTMRLIEQHEEPLCSMHDELKRTGKLSATHRRKLQQLVTELPAHVYQADLDAVQQALSA